MNKSLSKPHIFHYLCARKRRRARCEILPFCFATVLRVIQPHFVIYLFIDR
nr:MAG TPA: hypothetical protein [Caudoviricetes sp.]